MKERKRKPDRKSESKAKESATSKRKSSKPSKKQQQEKPAWMHTRPEEKDLHKPRQWNGKDWWYCHPDTGGKCEGEYRRHKPSQCEGKAFKIKAKDKKSKSKVRESSEDESKHNLRVANALSTIIDESEYATESDNSDDGYSS